ncbi:P-loop containing nucleoside triphosphate hydrolase protein [Collybia nuda]|uniref:ATP-dependent RNA helicase n=1 Tax=Collybia nuda TaxID=64659 RepID=A0A9P5Y5P7_9AGAR|nr:P-loop containing nucleoside triphosphate hydrolase protein [Collybia nuda]
MHPRNKKPRLAGPTTVSNDMNGRAGGMTDVDTNETAKSRHFSSRTFQAAPISNESKAGIAHEFMSDVQAATLDLALAGTDLLVQAKTGTGKTIAFLLPAIERLLALPPSSVRGISILVLAPTRELALQIEDEAQLLLAHHKHLTVGHAIGGTNINSSYNLLLSTPPTILIATPGRLVDLLSSPIPTHLAGKHTGNVAGQFSALKALIYDEADRLLDQGFKKELDTISRYLPDKNKVPRQAMLFSATVSKEIREVAAGALNKDYQFVSTLLEDEVNTHEHVAQSYIIAPFASTLPTALHILRTELATHIAPSQPGTGTKPASTSKTIVFFPTARHVSLAAELFEAIAKAAPGSLPPIYEIHSRKSQSARTKAAEGFRDTTCGVLLSSDVAARGMDFPGVTLVLQLNLPSDAEQYIHRLGRTARAGAAGRGVLVLDPSEEGFLRKKDVQGLGLVQDTEFYTTTSSALVACTSEIQRVLASSAVDRETKAAAYRAWLGYYNSVAKELRWSKERVVQEAGVYAREAIGWIGENVPDVEARAVGKMGLRGVPGLNIVSGKQGNAAWGIGDGLQMYLDTLAS